MADDEPSRSSGGDADADAGGAAPASDPPSPAAAVPVEPMVDDMADESDEAPIARGRRKSKTPVLKSSDDEDVDADDDDGDAANDSFLVDEEDDEDEDDGVAGGAAADASDDTEAARRRERRRKKRRRQALRLDDEDYDLLEENQVPGVRRPAPAQRRRIRKKGEVGGEGGGGGGGEPSAVAAAAAAPVVARATRAVVSDDDEEEEADEGEAGRPAEPPPAAEPAAPAPPPLAGEEAAAPAATEEPAAEEAAAAPAEPVAPTVPVEPADSDIFASDSSSGGESEVDDFIVQEGELDEDQLAALAPEERDAYRRERKAARRAARRAGRAAGGAVGAVAQELADLFGEEEELESMLAGYAKAAAAAAAGEAATGGGAAGAGASSDEEDHAVRADAFDGDAEAYETYVAEREARARARVAARVAAAVEPGALERHMLRPEDDAVRAADVPERLQEAGHRPPPGLDDAALDAAAAWVAGHLFGDGAPDSRPRDLVLDGVREVDGPPADGRPAYAPDELEGGATDLARGLRGVARRRTKDARRAWRKDEAARAALVSGVRAALRALWVDRLEVPWLATHAKGPAGVGDLLALRDADVPILTTAREAESRVRTGKPAYPAGTVQASGRKARRWDALWAVADAADAWAALARRKAARARTYARIVADEAAPDAERDAAAEAAGALSGAATADDVADIDARFDLARAAAAVAALGEADVGRLNLGGDAAAAADAPAPTGEGGEAAEAPMEAGDGGEEGAAAAPTVVPRPPPPPARKAPSGLRRPVRMSAYATCKKAGLGPLIDAFGLSAAALAGNAVAGYVVQAPDPASCEGKTPEQAAADLAPKLAAPFTNPEAALRGARATLAAEVAAEPALRALVRREFDRHGTVSTAPTPRGELSDRLDPFHPYGRVRRLADKPLRDFEGTDLFLRIDAAARAGLLAVTVALPADKLAALVGDFADASNAGAGDDAVSAAWADQRTAVMSEAISLVIRAVADAASRAALAAARGVAAGEYADALWRLATRGPVEVRRADEDEAGGGGGSSIIRPRFIAASHGPGAPATAFVALDEKGGLVDVLYCAHLSGRVRPPPRPRTGPGGVALPAAYSPLTDGRAAPDARALRGFIMAHAPHAVLVGCGGPDGRALRDVVAGVRDHILEHDPQFLTRHETGDVGVRLVDERLAELWAGTEAAASELPDAPPSVRRAVAVGRLGLDPLAVLAALAGRGRELAALQLTELQGELGPDAVLAAARRTLVTAVAQVGVDVNAAAACPWRAPPLAYVSGLGPRKAAALLKCVAGLGGRARSRAALRGGLGGLGPVVWRNAASFLRVRRPTADGGGAGPDEYDSDEDEDGVGGRGARHPLDDSRVHPEAYPAARAVAVAALTSAGRLPSRRRRRRARRDSESDGDEGGAGGGGGGGGGGTDDEWDAAVLKAVVGSRRADEVEAVDLAAVAAEVGGSARRRAGATPPPAIPMSTDAVADGAEAGGDGAVPAFEPAPAFDGPRPGRVFGTGPAGTGYYADLDPGSVAAARAAGGPPPLPPPALAAALPPLIDAAFELIAPFGEVRPDAAPTPADEFWLATGQRPDTLRPGLPVDMVIRWAGPHEARGSLPACGGVEAVIAAEHISSSAGFGAAVDPRDYFRPGDVVAARVVELLPDACEVRVATASSILNDAEAWEAKYCADVDLHYVPLTPAERAALAERAAGGGAARRKAALVKRPIAHPHFDNITEEEAVARLAAPEASVGEALLRPHPSGPHKLRLSVKLHAGAHGPIILHRDVLETGKVRGKATASSAPGHLALGLPLSVGLGAAGLKETYEDLDELLARHAEPLAAAAAGLAAHRKFVDDADWDRVKARLSAEFAAGGRRAAAYCICPCYGRPGTYFLGFVLPTARATPHREYFALTPDGLYYRSAVHAGGIERVLALFKRDPTNRAAAEAAAAVEAAAARAADQYYRGGGGGGATPHGEPPAASGYGAWGAAPPPPSPPPPPPQQYPYAQQGYGY